MLTVMLAAFGVMAAKCLREQIAYLVLASVAVLLIAVGLNNLLALSGSFYYLIHSTLIAGGLFLLADIISRGRGTFADRFEKGYAMPGAILIGTMYIFGAVAITGLPPLSGFFGKLLILKASLDHPWFGWVLGVVLVASFLMIIAMARTGSVLFYNVLTNDNADAEQLNGLNGNLAEQNVSSVSPGRVSTIAIICLFAMSPLLVLLAQPITAFTESAAKQQMDNKGYIDAVLSKQAVVSEKD
jgi:multicomponent K+:H+ antiporter subunit D